MAQVICDRCPAAGRHEVFTDCGPLYFCDHHLRVLTAALAAAGPQWTVTDLD